MKTFKIEVDLECECVPKSKRNEIGKLESGDKIIRGNPGYSNDRSKLCLDPWTQEGIKIVGTKSYLHRNSSKCRIKDRVLVDLDDKIALICQNFEAVKLSEVISDFYLLEGISHMAIFDGIEDPLAGLDMDSVDFFAKSFWCSSMSTLSQAEKLMFHALEARKSLLRLTNNLAKVFYEYSLHAAFRELRHHTSWIAFIGDESFRYDFLVLDALRKEFGDKRVVDWICKAFSHESSWDTSYGGRRWLQCLNITQSYLNGEINKFLYVDRILSAEHNTGTFLSKSNMIDYYGVREALDNHHYCNVDGLVSKASNDVKMMHLSVETLAKEIEETK